MNTTHIIKPGSGYWDATNYPIGGKFCRVPQDGDGLSVHVTSYGNLAQFTDADGRKLFVDERAFASIESGVIDAE